MKIDLSEIETIVIRDKNGKMVERFSPAFFREKEDDITGKTLEIKSINDLANY